MTDQDQSSPVSQNEDGKGQKRSGDGSFNKRVIGPGSVGIVVAGIGQWIGATTPLGRAFEYAAPGFGALAAYFWPLVVNEIDQIVNRRKANTDWRDEQALYKNSVKLMRRQLKEAKRTGDDVRCKEIKEKIDAAGRVIEERALNRVRALESDKSKLDGLRAGTDQAQ